MKTMKLFSMAAVALMMAACSNNDDNEIQQNTQQPGTMHFTATIAAPNADATTRTAYTEEGTTINVTWEVGDKIALVHNGVVDEAEVTAVDGSGKATIDATITSPSDNEVVYLAYPADAVESATPDYPLPFTPNPTTTFDKVKNQDGTLEFIQDNLDLRMGFGQLAVSGGKATLNGSVSVYSLICIWKLTLQDESSNALSATKLTFKNETYTQAKATSAAKSEYYLCVVPGYIPAPAGTYSFEATVGSDTYTFSKTSLSLSAGKYYKSTVKMKAPATAYTLAESTVGMIVGSDGKAYAAADKDNLPTGVTAAGMVAYKSGSNGLAIALANEASKMNWSTANGASGAAAHTPTVTGQTWKLPSKDEWDNMISAAGSYTDLRDGISSVGGTNMQSDDRYWSSTDSDSGYAWVYNFSNGKWGNGYKDFEYYVRACLAF